MRFPADSPVSAEKLDALREKIARLQVRLELVEEQFLRASGPGGQKVNKTSSAVRLHYPPLDISVKWARERSRALNRFLALRELLEEVELRVSPGTSERRREQDRVRERKRRRRRRAGG